MQPTESTETTTETNSPAALQLELVIPDSDLRPFVLTNNPEEDYIQIQPGLTHEQWTRGLFAFQWARERIDLAFPKYLAYGALNFGKQKALESVQQLEFDLPMVNEALKINSIPQKLRLPGLEAAHLVVLARAGLSKSEQTKWASIASEQQLSPTTLKLSIEEGEVITPEMAKQRAHGLYSAHGLRGDFDLWWDKRINGMEGIKAMKLEVVIEIANELERMALVYDQIMEFLASTRPVEAPEA